MGLRTKASIAVAVLTIGVLLLLPTLLSPWVKNWPEPIQRRMLKLGLDLKGGIHLVFEIDKAKHEETLAYRLLAQLKSAVREGGHDFLDAQVHEGTIRMTLLDDQAANDVTAKLLGQFPELRVLETRRNELVLKMNDAYVERMLKEASGRAVEIIRNRVDQFGVAEPDVRQEASGRIMVQLPGLEDPSRAIALIGRTALLEFRLVADDVSPEEAQSLPEYQVMYEVRDGERVPYVLERQPLLTGDMLKDATVGFDQTGVPVVNIAFNAQGARIFAEVTAANVEKRLAIVLDNAIYSAPVIREPIRGGRAQISGSFTTKDAHDLAIVLRAGALPAPVKLIEQTSVGPSLGKEAILRGALSLAVGFFLVVAFMAGYYRRSGLIADLCVLSNIVLVLSALALFGATLTLPGIAGIVLTVGMAVDANVLIVERIREELRGGLPLAKSIEEGFRRAFLTIIDTHVTTLVSAVILYFMGTGPIKGFAVTLFIGIAASLFTAVFMAKLIMDSLLARRKDAWLSF